MPQDPEKFKPETREERLKSNPETEPELEEEEEEEISEPSPSEEEPKKEPKAEDSENEADTQEQEAARLAETIEQTKAQINEARKTLGLPPIEKEIPSTSLEEERLEELRTELTELEKQKSKGLREEFLGALNEELTYMEQSGRITPDQAEEKRKLAALIETGFSNDPMHDALLFSRAGIAKEEEIIEILEKKKHKEASQEKRDQLIQEEKEKVFQEALDELFESFKTLRRREVQHIFETGQTLKGKNIESSVLGEVDPDLAQAIAKAFRGGVRLTLEILKALPKLAEKPEILEKLDKTLTEEAAERAEQTLAEEEEEEEKEIGEEEKETQP